MSAAGGGPQCTCLQGRCWLCKVRPTQQGVSAARTRSDQNQNRIKSISPSQKCSSESKATLDITPSPQLPDRLCAPHPARDKPQGTVPATSRRGSLHTTRLSRCSHANHCDARQLPQSLCGFNLQRFFYSPKDLPLSKPVHFTNTQPLELLL